MHSVAMAGSAQTEHVARGLKLDLFMFISHLNKGVV
jgi:hypothetical protein